MRAFYIWSSFPFVPAASLTVNILLPLTLLFVANQVTEVKWLKYLTTLVIVFGRDAAALFHRQSDFQLLLLSRHTRSF